MRTVRQRFQDMLDAIAKIQTHTRDGRTLFDRDETIRIWVIYHLQVIGEAARAIDDATRGQHPSIPWSTIVGMRHILVHEYFGLKWDVVWDTVEHDLPVLKHHVEQVVRDIDQAILDDQ